MIETVEKMAKNKKDRLKLLFGAGAILLLVVLINPPILSILGTTYWTIGDYTDVKVGQTIDLGAKVNAYNSNIAQSDKTVAGIDKYQDCELKIDGIDMFKEGGTTYVRLKTGSNYIETPYGQGDALYTCKSGGIIAMKFSPKECSSATSPSQYYTDYQKCNAFARIDLGIKGSNVVSIECQPGEVKTKTCWDDSEITVTSCVDNRWKSTGQSCPDKPPETTPPDTTPPDSGTTTPPDAGTTTPPDYDIPDDAVLLPEEEQILGINRDYWIYGLAGLLVILAGAIALKRR